MLHCELLVLVVEQGANQHISKRISGVQRKSLIKLGSRVRLVAAHEGKHSERLIKDRQPLRSILVPPGFVKCLGLLSGLNQLNRLVSILLALLYELRVVLLRLLAALDRGLSEDSYVVRVRCKVSGNDAEPIVGPVGNEILIDKDRVDYVEIAGLLKDSQQVLELSDSLRLIRELLHFAGDVRYNI